MNAGMLFVNKARTRGRPQRQWAGVLTTADSGRRRAWLCVSGKGGSRGSVARPHLRFAALRMRVSMLGMDLP